MQILNIKQGTDEWIKARRGKFCASDAPAMMGVSPYESRDQLIERLATGVEKEHTPIEQELFKKGHVAEALARKYIEKKIDDDLYPVVVVSDDDKFLASMDGLTIDGTIGFEHKLINNEIKNLEYLSIDIPLYFAYQLEHQLLISNAEYILFVISDGSEESLISRNYYSKSDLKKSLLSGWEQLEKDIANYQPRETITNGIANVDPLSLPSINVNTEGKISVITNIDDFGVKLQSYLEKINFNPETDDDFANLGLAAKELRKAENALQEADKRIADAVDIGTIRDQIGVLSKTAREWRLKAEKLEKEGKDNKKRELIINAKNQWSSFITDCNKRLSLVIYIPDPEFIEAVRGIKTLESYRSALNDCIAKNKIQAQEIYNTAADNLKLINSENKFLFPDLTQIIAKSNEDFANLVNSRIAEHRELEAKKEAERKAAEDKRIAEAKLQAEKTAQEKAQREIAEAERLARVKAELEAQAKLKKELSEKEEKANPISEVDKKRNEIISFISKIDIQKLEKIYKYLTKYYEDFKHH